MSSELVQKWEPMNHVIDKHNAIGSFIGSASREREKLDKLIFAVTAGTLSISITFISSSEQIFNYKNYLLISWSVLLFGLFSILFAYVFAILHFMNCAKEVRLKSSFRENGWLRIVSEIFNWLSLISVVVGITFFAYFGYLNIK